MKKLVMDLYIFRLFYLNVMVYKVTHNTVVSGVLYSNTNLTTSNILFTIIPSFLPIPKPGIW